jgi:hypothetical protein
MRVGFHENQNRFSVFFSDSKFLYRLRPYVLFFLSEGAGIPVSIFVSASYNLG